MSNPKRIKIGDTTIELAGKDNAEQAAMIICVPVAEADKSTMDKTSAFHEIERCSKCGQDVLIMKTAPKKPARYCWDCAIDHIGGVESFTA